jgi:hypothetical protein
VILPNAHDALVDRRKVTDYLLSTTHPDGAPKARFFMAFGFSANRPDDLIIALAEHGRSHHAKELQTRAYGTRYRVDGRLRSPDGRDPMVRTIWMVRAGETVPRLVTAIPMKGRMP